MILNNTFKRKARSIYKSKDLALFLKTRATLKTFTKYRPVSVEVSCHSKFQRVSDFDYLGAYGEVRKCLHKETKALRAVKII